MKKSEIKLHGLYSAKVSGKLTTVRVDAIRETTKYRSSYGQRKPADTTVYDVTNLTTGRKTAFRSAAKFRSEVKTKEPRSPTGAPEALCAVLERKMEGDNRSDPTISTATTRTGRADGQGDENRLPFAPPTLPASTPASTATAAPNGSCSTAGASAALADGTAATPLTRLLRKSIDQTVGAPHLIVKARAGTGKTTTLVEGLKRIKGEPVKITPSPQQAAVWEQMALSKDAKTICFVAFNKSIATELKNRVPNGCNACTMHSMGLQAVTKAFGRLDVNSFVAQDIIAEIMGMDIREIRKNKFAVLKAIEELVSLCKMNLSDTTVEALEALASHYEIDLNGSAREVFELVPEVLERCKQPRGRIGFDDMIWLPVILDLPIFCYDLLLVDESQDLNRCQQALARKAGRRLILVGDERQAIYGFAGADAQSMARMKDELSADPRGCVEVPLTVTRRCGKAIVEEARKIVGDFEAHESNGEGKISRAAYDEKSSGANGVYHTGVLDGDMLLCRVNAPLVSQCFRFLRQGRRANIQGRDIGQGLISTIKKLKAASVVDLVANLSDWLHQESAKENAKRSPSEARLIALQDRYDCLMCFTEGAATVEAVIAKIETIFTDNKNGVGIKLSSIHKAKGLESRRVFFLQPKGGECPHPLAKSAWQRKQEMNLRYVAITRSIEELIYVS